MADGGYTMLTPRELGEPSLERPPAEEEVALLGGVASLMEVPPRVTATDELAAALHSETDSAEGRPPAPFAVLGPARASPVANSAASIGPAPVINASIPATLGATTKAMPPPQPTIANAVRLLQSTAASAAATAAKTWHALAGLVSPEEPYTASRPAAPPEGTTAPQSPSPPPEPLDYGSLALSGSGSASSTGGVGPLLLGILALGGLLLLRRDFGTYLAWCEPPRLESALLKPLECPG